LVLGVVGWLMKAFNFPRAPFLIGFVLSIPLERYYYLTDNLYSFSEWAFRPGVLAMAAILLLPVVLAVVRKVRPPKKTPVDEDLPDDDDHVDEELGPRTWSAVVSGGFLAVFIVAFILALQFPSAASLLPRIITIIGAVLSLVALVVDLRALRIGERFSDEDAARWRTVVRTVAIALAWLLAFVVLTYILGAVVAAAIYVPVFLWRVAHASWRALVIYPVILVAVLLVARAYAEIVLPLGYINLGI
ncbi:MAG TPA: tripartite tricarboxylate transporter TctB family protein, partial [Nocardioides sp.]|nr:tripartite tricarboxylate transporter TctB family protein [Nocardioides sp.]